MVRKMEERFGQAQRVWVMDRGMVSEANIAMLRERKALYVLGTPKSLLRAYEPELAEKESWAEVQRGVEARLVAHPGGDCSTTLISPHPVASIRKVTRLQ